MIEEQYIKESEETLSDLCVVNQKTFKTLSNDIDDLLKLTNNIDLLKKLIFYDKAKAGLKLLVETDEDDETSEILNKLLQDKSKQKILHGALGMFTESVEILEEVFNSIIEKRDLDRPNIIEELGDSRFYETIFLRELDIDPTLVRKINRKKLGGVRYKDGFTSEDADKRDLEAERKVLEQNEKK